MFRGSEPLTFYRLGSGNERCAGRVRGWAFTGQLSALTTHQVVLLRPRCAGGTLGTYHCQFAVKFLLGNLPVVHGDLDTVRREERGHGATIRLEAMDLIVHRSFTLTLG